VRDLETSDRLDLAELVAAYAAAVDRRAAEGLVRLFVPDAVLVMPDPPRSLTPVIEAVGRDAILVGVGQLTAFARTFHHVTGSVWAAEGRDAATGRTTTVAHHVEDAEVPRSWVWHVIYDDRCVRSDEGWQFERRALTIAMIEARPVARVLAFDDSPHA
jgi:ketosteroid isomerase-like protein